MGHEMTENDRMYSVREAPWHMGTGTNVLMLDTAPETRMLRIDAAGHGFTVEENDVYLRRDLPASEPGSLTPRSRRCADGRRSPARTRATS